MTGLFFWGEAGTGKTELATHLGIQARKNGLRVFQTSETTLYDDLAKVAPYPSYWPEFIDSYDVFIFDDMNGSTNMIERDAIRHLVKQAHDKGDKRIIFTSNGSYKAFIERSFGLKITSHIDKEGSRSTVTHGTEGFKKLFSRLTAAIDFNESVFEFKGKDLRLSSGF